MNWIWQSTLRLTAHKFNEIDLKRTDHYAWVDAKCGYSAPLGSLQPAMPLVDKRCKRCKRCAR